MTKETSFFTESAGYNEVFSSKNPVSGSSANKSIRHAANRRGQETAPVGGVTAVCNAGSFKLGR
ncbi:MULTISPECIES: hypothetical protein [Kamptonema]|uniref:hypothetical protein n=1 Tax=Kamptonema TaxID=1501433 RepID=UPI0001DAC38B|nr:MULTISPECIES: hypothetical protein [Kamptonema]CBN54267.1 hypothetical protein OSCI_760002 [Kamptonema sp. PCC 6506]